jgi:HAD superfamily hydrolase (TIGR01509 family)
VSPRAAITIIFTLNGFAIGTWGARVPAIQERLDVGPGGLAVALVGLSAGALIAMPLAGRAASRRGSRPIVRAGLIAIALTLPLPAVLPGLPLVTLGVLAFGLSNGTLDVSMNAQGVAVERGLRRHILSSLHAGFSFGGLLGAGAGALAATAGLEALPHFAAVTALVLCVGVPATRRLVEDRAAATAGEATTARAPSAGAATHPGAPLSRTARWRLRGIAFCCLFAEGAAMDWSAVHLRSIGAAAGLAAVAYAGFSLAMASGRLVGDRISERWGGVAIARRGGLAGAAALAAALIAGVPGVAIAAYLVLGAGLAVIVPLVFRAAASGAAAGPALAAVTSTGYLGFLAGPPIIGAVASLTSVPAAVVLVVAAALAVGLGAGALRGGDQPAGAAEPAPAMAAPAHDPLREAAACRVPPPPSSPLPRRPPPMIRPFHAILSDLDGVLVDSGDSIVRTWRRWAAGHGLPQARLDGLMHGRPSREVVALVAPDLDPDREAETIDRYEIEGHAARALPGARELLGGATDAPVAIVTSCTRRLAVARLEALDLPVPDVLVTVDDVAAGKPDPEGYRAAAERLGVAPRDCLVFEDSPAGIAAGRSAGASVCGITTTHPPAELHTAGALAASVAEALARYRPSSLRCSAR